MKDGLLEARDVRMVFGGVIALDGASISVQPGRITGLIGRNGSGKSTLFNCLTGFLAPTSGSITLDGGHDLMLDRPAEVLQVLLAAAAR